MNNEVIITLIGTVIVTVIAAIIGPIIVENYKRSKTVDPQTNKVFEGRIEKVWVEHNIKEGEKKGFKIHIKFGLKGLDGTKCTIGAFFHYKNGKKLFDQNDSYRSYEGQVSIGNSFTPNEKIALFSDFELFMPFEELHLPKEAGDQELKFSVSIYKEDNFTFITDHSWHHFLGNSLKEVTMDIPYGVINTVDVHYDEVVGLDLGIKILINFDVKNMLNIECKAAAYFYNALDEPLKDQNNLYDTTTGHIAVSEKFIPPYENTTYSGFELSIPYNELHLGSGTHNIKFKIDLYVISTNNHFITSGFYSLKTLYVQ